MIMWQFWLIFGILVLLIDLFTSTMFLINISLGLFLTSVCAYLGFNIYVQLTILFVTSSLFLAFLRPYLVKTFKQRNYNEFDDKYIGHNAKVIVKVTSNGGRIVVFGEEWSAKTFEDKTFEVGDEVKIIKQESMIMFVDKI